MPKPQIRITFEVVPSVNSGPAVSADIRQLINGSWEYVVVDDKPIEPISSTENGARLAAVAALNGLFGEDGYELVN